MLQVVGIALLHAGQRGLGQCGLDAHHGGGFLFGDLRRIAQQLKHLLHVLQVALANLLGFGVFLGVVVAVGKSEAALLDADNHRHRSCRGPASGRCRKACHRLRDAAWRPAAPCRWMLFSAAISSRSGCIGLAPSFSTWRLVHAGGVVVADLLGHGVAVLWPRPTAPEWRAEKPDCLRTACRKRSTRSGRRDGIVLHPSAAGVGVEVDAGIDGAVHVGQVEAGRVGQGRARPFALSFVALLRAKRPAIERKRECFTHCNPLNYRNDRE